MDKDELKIYLKDNSEHIRDILEDMGCKSVRVGRKRISATRPNGDNKGAISITLNDFLSTKVYTRNSFDTYKIQDFYSLIDYINGYNLNDALKYVHKICGLKYVGKFKETTVSESCLFLKTFKRIKKQESEDIYEESLEEYYREQFIFETCKLFFDDGINEKTQDRFEVGYDPIQDRIIFVIRNEDGKLLSFKGRTNDKDWKFKGLNKYIYYYPYIGERHLYGYYQNIEDIKKSEEVVVFESEKSVQQCDSFGVNNALATGKKTISYHQRNLLIKIGKPVVIAFDKDVTLEEIYIECRKFNNLIDVYYIYDKDDLLDNKQSPSDKGREIYSELLKNKIKYEGE